MLHRTLDPDSLIIVLGDIKNIVPTTGLKQFWENSPTHYSEQPHSNLWIHVIFCYEKYINFQKEFIVPSIRQCCDYLKSITLSQEEVNQIKVATREQARSNLWHALYNGRITSSRFGEILHRRHLTDSQRIVKDVMGYKKNTPNISHHKFYGEETMSLAHLNVIMKP
uniref:Uncharacterized protein n=1 Tax=Amphimedon queenslandica TaxID=400682 RepID=A0A1X7VSU8_AMPQE